LASDFSSEMVGFRMDHRHARLVHAAHHCQGQTTEPLPLLPNRWSSR
jgi:hypothetical protein